jgi:hypothetical protein
VRVLLTVAAAALVAFVFSETPGSIPAVAAEPLIDPDDFSHRITNRLFPVSTISFKLFEGEETDPDTGETIETRLESRVLADRRRIMGVRVVTVEERAYEDDEIVEVAWDYYAQHDNGDVYYFGEHVDNYEDGVVDNHGGQWIAGEVGAMPGIIMPRWPRVGQTFQQEFAPGIAEDMATVLRTNVTVTVPAGTFRGCLKTLDFTPLEPGIWEFKWYCPGVGLVKERGEDFVNELVEVVYAREACDDEDDRRFRASRCDDDDDEEDDDDD